MPGFNPENINIHDLTIEEPEEQAEVFFDPEKDLTQEDWDRITETLNWYKPELERSPDMTMGSRQVRPYTELLSYLATLKNESIKLTKADKELLERLFKNTKKSQDPIVSPATVAREAASLAILNQPHKLDQKHFDDIDGAIGANFEKGAFATFTGHIAMLKIAGYEPKTAYDPDAINKVWEEWRKEKLVGLPYIASNLAIMGLKPNLTKEDWALMNEELNQSRTIKTKARDHLKGYDIARQAFRMAILAADEVQIPEGGGLELISHKKQHLTSESPELPEQRKF